MSDSREISNGRQQRDAAEFETRFSRSRSLLYFVACRVLEGSEGADEAVGRCFLKARENPPEFHYQGAFRSWLVRILIDEALLILIEKRGGSTRSREQVFSE